MFEYQQGKISEKWPNFVDLIWPPVNLPNFTNLERISSGKRIAAEFSVPNSIFALPATGTTWVRIEASSLFANDFVGQSTHLQPVFQCLQFNTYINNQHLTSILILNDYLGPSSHCDRSGICKTYCLDLLWVYKNSSSLTSPKKSYILCDIFLLGSCAANCHCFLQIIRAKYYDIYSNICLRIMCGPQCCHVQRRRGRSLGAFWQHPPEPLWTKVFFRFVKILRKYCTWLIFGIPFGGIKNRWTLNIQGVPKNV